MASIGGAENKCVIRLTAVGFPSFVYDLSQRTGFIKLNAKLIPLSLRGDRLFADGGLRVLVRPVDEDFGSDGRREAELILALPGAKQERGYRGYEACPRAARE